MKYLTTPKNVTGPERAASVIGGLALVGSGLRSRGLRGLLQITLGGMALLRGATGHCELKKRIAEQRRSGTPNIERYAHMPLDSDVRTSTVTSPQASPPDNPPMGQSGIVT